jgi:hypothetical protein
MGASDGLHRGRHPRQRRRQRRTSTTIHFEAGPHREGQGLLRQAGHRPRFRSGRASKRSSDNLGPLLEFVEPHQGKIEAMQWGGGPISLLITDAPKRVPAISAVLTNSATRCSPARSWRGRISATSRATRFRRASIGCAIISSSSRPWCRDDAGLPREVAVEPC